MATNIRDVLLEKVQALSPEQQEQVLSFVENMTAQDQTATKSIWDEIDEITQSAPEGTWDSVPPDSSLNVDHYLYGAPKK
ncbi:MAG: hypothetical protein NVSMB56_15660 [Pyrinomonadaceae bacterium]